jgi:hypothetical protein
MREIPERFVSSLLMGRPSALMNLAPSKKSITRFGTTKRLKLLVFAKRSVCASKQARLSGSMALILQGGDQI